MYSLQEKNDQFGLVDRLTRFSMEQVSRRGFLKAFGAVGLALLGLSADIRIAMAHIACPGSCAGYCDNCFSWCASSGMTCECECPSCNCNPPVVSAVGVWIPNYGTGGCLFTCGCEAC